MLYIDRYIIENLFMEGQIGVDINMMLLPSRYVAGIEFSDALLYKPLPKMACVLAVPSNGRLPTPHVFRY
jgi:hypothetical protein